MWLVIFEPRSLYPQGNSNWLLECAERKADLDEVAKDKTQYSRKRNRDFQHVANQITFRQQIAEPDLHRMMFQIILHYLYAAGHTQYLILPWAKQEFRFKIAGLVLTDRRPLPKNSDLPTLTTPHQSNGFVLATMHRKADAFFYPTFQTREAMYL